ncbi:MAG: hypothetical protein QOF13_2246, partial [Solirubrobacterales bacterium]|nr:hypothetical protein [Solirubrobacterales bacterium]
DDRVSAVALVVESSSDEVPLTDPPADEQPAVDGAGADGDGG